MISIHGLHGGVAQDGPQKPQYASEGKIHATDSWSIVSGGTFARLEALYMVHIEANNISPKPLGFRVFVGRYLGFIAVE